ncbi:DUF2141 domain-containing protein [Winogradskyella sp.]|jgi:uncharacterized protein (DUF2141 family)|uniref:DUF2141 domain-containing protein n=1 Tax=Winogradskyella sp. TaxID=1883156 RepID=UPI0025DA96A8|nr:DUF2141 domain-containing protein [Winogradskyella sp.]MCT4628773.1 DUF2141 domain-containing protein [Winogradskyella sp.]
MSTLIKIAVVLIISLVSFSSKAQESYNLIIEVEEANSNDGKMFVAVYNEEAKFLRKSYKGTKSKIVNNSCSVTFEDLPKGTYAVSIYHDKNNNGKLDRNFLGIPKESYGCSNDAKGFMGPPKWNDAKFELKTNKTITVILN